MTGFPPHSQNDLQWENPQGFPFPDSDAEPVITPPNFSRCYCEQNRIRETDFAAHVLKRVMHWPSNWVVSLLLSIDQDLLRADLDLLQVCRRINHRRDLEIELAEFSYDPRNMGFWRGKLHQRISTHRLRRLFKKTMRTNKD